MKSGGCEFMASYGCEEYARQKTTFLGELRRVLGRAGSYDVQETASRWKDYGIRFVINEKLG